MQTRFRWFKVLPLAKPALAKLAKHFQASIYGKTVSRGFRLESVRSDRIEGIFIERREYEETLIDPLGDDIRIHRVAFEHLPFTINATSGLLRVTNPGKLVPVLTELIASALDYSVAITAVELDPLSWLKSISSAQDTVVLTALKSFPISLSNSISGVVKLSGEGEMIKELSALLGSNKFKISNLTVRLIRGSLDCKFELRSSGVAVVHKGSAHEVCSVLGSSPELQ
jgi:hypothetical protein